MHQYQMHRTQDDLKKKCRQPESIDLPMKKCYWRKPVPVPREITSKFDVYLTGFEENVQVCQSLPDDIKIYFQLNQTLIRIQYLIVLLKEIL